MSLSGNFRPLVRQREVGSGEILLGNVPVDITEPPYNTGHKHKDPNVESNQIGENHNRDLISSLHKVLAYACYGHMSCSALHFRKS